MSHRQVWKTARAKSFSDLQLQSEALPALKPDHVRVQVRAVGLNFADIFGIIGLYAAAPKTDFIPGLEFAGTVICTGDAVEDVKFGSAVMGVTRFGGYASVIDIKPAYCLPLPEGWSFEQGAAYPVQTLTAYYALKPLGDVRPGQNVLIHSAAGGVGLQAMRICQKLGANPLGTVGNPAKIDRLKTMGFNQVVVRTPNWVEQVKSILNGERLDLALDAIGGHVQKDTYKLLSPMSRLVVYGSAEFTPHGDRPNPLRLALKYLRRPLYDPMKMAGDNKSVMAFNLIWLYDQVNLFKEMIDALDRLELEPPFIGQSFPFTAAPQAVDHLRSGKSTGKVVLVVE
ncbi:MAG: zinc-binding dehydrogenase [Gemmatimonadetes bacterium]|nr:MAG: zinc-binding dehydrogenase [Gemmatimonadota bacterium]